MANQLSELLISLRGDRTLREVAELANISHAYLGLLEKGVDRRTNKEIKPSVETLKKLSEVYNYSFEILMDAAGYLPQETNTEAVNNDEFTKKIIGIVKRPGLELTKSEEDNLLILLKQAVKMIEDGKNR